jgi:hypothetical protein
MATYDAFISYSHTDQHAANRVQTFLESYRLPETAGRERRKRRKLRIYRDKTDIRAGSLREEILAALAESACLLVCCSTASAASEWVAGEASAFLAGGADRPVILVLLEGERKASIPTPLLGRDDLVIDLRQGWFMGMLRPAKRLELVRAAACIAGLDLRQLIPWDKRRRRQRAALVGLAVAGICLAALAAPVRTWRELPVIPEVQRLDRIVSCEMQEGRLALASRHRGVGPQGGRDYVALHPDAINAPEEVDWLENNFNPSSRLMPINAADREMVQRFHAAVDAELFSQALAQQDGGYPPEIWLGEPTPGTFLAVFALPREMPVDEFSAVPPAQALVLTASRGKSVLGSLEGLDPPDLPTQVRAFAPSQGLAAAQGAEALWLGARINELGDSGGLWHSSDGGARWEKVGGFFSVGSLLVDARTPGRVLAADAPGVRMDGLYEVNLSARLQMKSAQGNIWEDFYGPPYEGNSELELCGYLPDGALLVRVDERLYVRRWTYNLERLIHPPKISEAASLPAVQNEQP